MCSWPHRLITMVDRHIPTGASLFHTLTLLSSPNDLPSFSLPTPSECVRIPQPCACLALWLASPPLPPGPSRPCFPSCSRPHRVSSVLWQGAPELRVRHPFCTGRLLLVSGSNFKLMFEGWEWAEVQVTWFQRGGREGGGWRCWSASLLQKRFDKQSNDPGWGSPGRRTHS